MTCRRAFFADAILPCSIDDRGDYPTYRQTSEGDLDTALITRVMQRLNSPPPLVLTAAHQRQTMILDRDRAAKRMDTQAVHRIENDLRKLTSRILAKGACFE